MISALVAFGFPIKMFFLIVVLKLLAIFLDEMQVCKEGYWTLIKWYSFQLTVLMRCRSNGSCLILLGEVFYPLFRLITFGRG